MKLGDFAAKGRLVDDVPGPVVVGKVCAVSSSIALSARRTPVDELGREMRRRQDRPDVLQLRQ